MVAPSISSEMVATAISMNSDGIGECDLVAADMAERGDLLDLELMDRIGHCLRLRPSCIFAHDRRLTVCLFVRRNRFPAHTPAARMTFSTPAANPKQQEDDQAPRRNSKPAVEQPAEASLRPSRLRPAPSRAGSRAPSPKDRRPVWAGIALVGLPSPASRQACCRDSGASRIERLLRQAGSSIHSCRARRQPCLRHSRCRQSRSPSPPPKPRGPYAGGIPRVEESAPQRTQTKTPMRIQRFDRAMRPLIRAPDVACNQCTSARNRRRNEAGRIQGL